MTAAASAVATLYSPSTRDPISPADGPILLLRAVFGLQPKDRFRCISEARVHSKSTTKDGMTLSLFFLFLFVLHSVELSAVFWMIPAMFHACQIKLHFATHERAIIISERQKVML